MSVIRGDIPVRAMAQFCFAQGDLYPVRRGPAVDADDGIRVQQSAQTLRRQLYAGYESERTVSMDLVLAGHERRLAGRIDGCYAKDERCFVVEEFKACGLLPDQPNPVDMGQLLLYAGLLAADTQGAEQMDTLVLHLVYVQADNGAERVFDETLSRSRAQAYLACCLLCVDARLRRHGARSRARAQWAAQLKFPMPAFRPSQQALARRVYRAMNSSEHLLLEAPTGSGKTLGVLFPALKAQPPQGQIFFLTSRNAGARAALTATVQLDPRQHQLNIVELTAKEKMCPVPGTPCSAERCPYAAGYFDRVQSAVNELLDLRHADRDAISTVAEQHQVCPFELSLDASVWADLVIGDYNYLLDPVVRLQRFVDHTQLQILVDEAHQLSPRVADMLSTQITRAQVRAAADTAVEGVSGRIRSMDRALMTLRRTHGEGEHQLAEVEQLERAMTRLLETVAELELELTDHAELMTLVFAVVRWQRLSGVCKAEEAALVMAVQDRQITLRRVCLDPSRYIRQVISAYDSSVRLSGTVSPLSLYQRLHGFADAPAERAQSPFAPEQNEVLIVNDVPTYLRQRRSSLPKLVDLIHGLMLSGGGRCLVALPSYAYLQMVAEAFCHAYPAMTVLLQSQGQDHQATSQMLDEFAALSCSVLFIVSGGVMGESVDFSGVGLTTVVLVGLGLPPPAMERDLKAEYFEHGEGAGWGQMVAYTQPALVRNVQAAGRLIRSPDDAGVICMVDHRFAHREVQGFFPSHWQPRVVPAREAARIAQDFWAKRKSVTQPEDENAAAES